MRLYPEQVLIFTLDFVEAYRYYRIVLSGVHRLAQQKILRRNSRSMYPEQITCLQTDGLIWVVDSADRGRLKDCKRELHDLLEQEVKRACHATYCNGLRSIQKPLSWMFMPYMKHVQPRRLRTARAHSIYRFAAEYVAIISRAYRLPCPRTLCSLSCLLHVTCDALPRLLSYFSITDTIHSRRSWQGLPC